MSEPLKSWFVREILVHEEALVRYLNRTWPHRDEVCDLRQEVYIRVFEAAAVSRPVLPKAFLFSTARHLLADKIRRGRIVSIEAVGHLEVLNVLEDERSPERLTQAREELRRLAQAIDRLPSKCREAVWLRRVDDLSQKEVADRLGISPRTVEHHLAKGMQTLADTLFGNTGDSKLDDKTNLEYGHGQQQSD